MKIDVSRISGYEKLATKALEARETLETGKGAGNDFLGWVHLPSNLDLEEYKRIKIAADKIKKNCDIFLVIGIGGSYLGARAVIDLLANSFASLRNEKDLPKIVYCGNNLSPKYIADLVDLLKDKDFSINVISKSGTTTEPAIAFRICEKLAIGKYKEKAKEHIFVTTDKKKGALKTLADNKGYETFVVPDDVGGRYSVLTAVGLLPIAISGVDIDKLIDGAKSMEKTLTGCKKGEISDALKYAMARNYLYEQGLGVELFTNYEPSGVYFGEWLKQLFGESEGKEHKGIFPASANFTTDLHSLGQFIQDGSRLLFETIIDYGNVGRKCEIPSDKDNLDNLNYLAGKDVSFVNNAAMMGTIKAHEEGKVPQIVISLDALDEKNVGEMIYFFEYTCGVSGYMLGVNPFNQPGVELYKKNMFAILGKPTLQ